METMLAFIGHTELFIIIGVVVLLFGATKIPQLMRGMGQGVGEFKKGLSESQEGKTEEKKEGDKGKDGEKKDS